MNYEQKYKNALERARELMTNQNPPAFDKHLIEIVFPELAESEDEKIKKAIKKALQVRCGGSRIISDEPVTLEEAIAWLEKQGKQTQLDYEHADIPQKDFAPIEPKFKVGDWITNGCLTCKVLGVTGNSYELHLHNDDYCHFETDIQSVNKYYHLWAIQDAKDGDVLTTDNFIFIFKSIDNSNGVHYYCHYEISKHEDDSPRFGIALSQSLMGIVGGSFTHYKPATKEQCDLLFQKMKEAGYVWDANKKELKKIEDEKLMRELN